MGENLRIALCTVSVLLIAGCSGNKSTNDPKKADPFYKLLYSYADPNHSVLTFNTNTGEVIDSTPYDGQAGGFSDIAFSRDGEFTYYTRGGSIGAIATWVTHSTGGDTVAISKGNGGHHLELSSDGKYLLTSRGTGIILYSLPDLTILFRTETLGDFLGVFHPSGEIIYYAGLQGDSTLQIVDYSSLPPKIRIVTLLDKDGSGLLLTNFTPSGDGRLLIVNNGWGPRFLQVFDTDSFKVVKDFSSANYPVELSQMLWHPDGNQLLLLYYGDFLFRKRGLIYSLDVQRMIVDTLIAPDRVGISEHFYVADGALTPDGKTLFVTSPEILWPGPIYAFDMNSKTLRLTIQARNGTSAAIGMDPRPIALF